MRRSHVAPRAPIAYRTVAVVLVCSSVARADPGYSPPFEKSAWPVLAAHCVGCHGADGPKAGLDLRTVAAIARGGDSGPAAIDGEPAASLLLQRIESGEMPPGDRRKPTADEVALLRAWVRAGMPAEHPDEVPPPPTVSEADRQHWAFQPLVRPAVPAVASANDGPTPIDTFLLARLEQKGLAFSPPADPVTLMRRAYLDVIGLPPAPAEVDAFLADASPGAYERLIDRLLASPHFGERWGRHWLDVAGYVDTVGFDVDANNVITSEGKWRYRDYVIGAFNQDKPYDTFIAEQLAGDELHDWRGADRFTPEMLDALIATGYLRTARDMTHEDVGVIPQNFYGVLHDTLEIVGTGLLGLTVNCARCHSHKFDPIPQEDYYRLMALFTPGYNPADWRTVIPFDSKARDRSLPDVSPAEQARIEAHNRALDDRIAPLNQRLAELRQPYHDRLFAERLAAIPDVIRADTQAAIAAAADQRSAVQKYLVEKFSGTLQIKPEEVAAALNDPDRAAVATLDAEIATHNTDRRTWGKVQALVDLGPPPPTHLLVRGEYENPGEEVPPGFLRVLSYDEANAVFDANSASADGQPPVQGSSGRRLALARWLTDRDSPAAGLLARVLVNRLWGQLFGRGIVTTADNFGIQGQPPTHPELLEWLSAELIAGDWRIKPLLRAMLTSAAYRQASRRDAATAGQPDPLAIDPGNDLWWRMPLRRLESEIVRDCILAASGQLNPAAGGPPILTEAQPDGAVVVARAKLAEPADEFRRSVYLLSRRAYNLSLLTVFDQPQVATNCLDRDASAVPLQSLTMLNDAFFQQQAERLAERVIGGGAATPQEQIESAFRLVLVRRPTADEIAWCAAAVVEQAELYRMAGSDEATATRQALTQLCHTLFNTSESLYAE